MYALAIFEHCPYENLTQDDMNSLGRFITTKDHLQRANAVGNFDHAVQVKIAALRCNLWEFTDMK